MKNNSSSKKLRGYGRGGKQFNEKHFKGFNADLSENDDMDWYLYDQFAEYMSDGKKKKKKRQRPSDPMD